MNVLISVIVPVYNVEKYLEDCLTSIVNQTYSNLEIIIVNDGSTDKSRDICERYVHKDNRIKLFSLNNHGVSYARNYGIKMSKGTLITFVDPDDVLHKDYLFELMRSINENKTDLGIVGFTRNMEQLGTNANSQLKLMDKEELVDDLVTGKIDGYLWNKIFKTNIIKNNNILFDEKLIIWEDLLFVMDYISYVCSAGITEYTLYYYRKNENGVTTTFSIEKQKACLVASKEMCCHQFDDKRNLLNTMSQKIYNETVLYLCLMYLRERDFKSLKQYFEEIKCSFNKIDTSIKNKMFFVLIRFICRVKEIIQ